MSRIKPSLNATLPQYGSESVRVAARIQGYNPATAPPGFLKPGLNQSPVLPSAQAPLAFDPELAASGMRSTCFFLLCVYLVSNLANDFTQRFLGSRAYLSLVAGAMLPVVCLLSGAAFNGLKYRIGRWWAALMVWMVICIPFSFWPGGSTDIVREFFTKNYVLFFYILASVVSIKQIQTLFKVMVFGGAMVILAAFLFGRVNPVDGRLLIPDSIFFDNSNDLALQLLISMGFFGYLLLSKNMFARTFGLGLSGAALLYILKTGSRANFLAVVVCMVVMLFLARKKVMMAAAMVVLGVIALIATPTKSLNRLTSFFWSDTDTETEASMSQMERQDMVRRSAIMTLTHPVFGVGPGMFSEVLWAESKARGQRIYLKTHNAYTQVSSEMGFPGLIFYLGTQLSAILLTFRVFRKARTRPEWEEIRTLSLCLFLILIGYSVSSIFDHVAYSRHLPTLAGMSLALHVLASRIMNTAPTYGVPWLRAQATPAGGNWSLNRSIP